MLNQNVPNPLAKNPNFHTHKVFAAIGIILIVIIIISGGIWYLVQSVQDKTGVIDDNTVIKTATSSATTGWKTYTNKTVGYEVKYPAGWVSSNTSEEKDCGVRFGVNKDQLGYCAAGNGGLLQLGLVTIHIINDSLTNQLNNSKSITGFKQSNAIVGGKTAVKITGTQNDNKEIEYLVDMSGSVLSVGFYAWPENTADYSSDFERMVSTFKFL